MKFLVTGGAGFIGSNLVRALIGKGHSVRVLDDYTRGSRDRLNDVDICFYPGSVDRPEHRVSLGIASDGVDAVIHLAAVNGTANFYNRPGRVLGVGVRGIVNVMDACIARGVKELYIASSSEVYQGAHVVPTPENVPLIIPDPYNPRYSYAAGKIISEMMGLYYASEYLRRVVIFRPHNVYGPDMGDDHVIPHFARKLFESILDSSNPGRTAFVLQGTGKETRSYCHIDDAVLGILKVIEYGQHRGIYNVGIQQETSAETLARIMGGYFGLELDISPSPLAKGSASRRCPDISKLRALDWEPKVSLREGLYSYLDWFTAKEKASCPAS